MEIEKLKQQNNLLNNQTAQLLKEKESEKNTKTIQGNLEQIEKNNKIIKELESINQKNK